jgi:putative ABC transport system permease protein
LLFTPKAGAMLKNYFVVALRNLLRHKTFTAINIAGLAVFLLIFEFVAAEWNTNRNVFIASAVISVIIACIGLFGLAAFTAQQRTKEIGIRKVLGASVTNIASLLSKDFVKLVFIAICIASPIAWWALSKWLLNFAYRTNMGWWIFAGAGMMALLIVVLTVSFQAVKAAVANPVRSLRTE